KEQAEIFELILDNNSSTKKRLVRSEPYGPIDNYAVWALSKDDAKQFNKLLFRITVFCGWSLSWVNNPEVKACYKFLNLLLIFPDRRTL
ncbi:1649_t:CDS:2, partial [Gigaspora margarita]